MSDNRQVGMIKFGPPLGAVIEVDEEIKSCMQNIRQKRGNKLTNYFVTGVPVVTCEGKDIAIKHDDYVSALDIQDVQDGNGISCFKMETGMLVYFEIHEHEGMVWAINITPIVRKRIPFK